MRCQGRDRETEEERRERESDITDKIKGVWLVGGEQRPGVKLKSK